jgi:hypothetical protein
VLLALEGGRNLRLTDKRGRTLYSNIQIIEAYKILSKKLDKNEYGATVTDIEKAYRVGEFPVHPATINKRFKDINNLRTKAEYKERAYTKKTKQSKTYTTVELIKHLDLLVSQKKLITLRNFGYKREPAVIRLYGSWIQFLKINGIDKTGDIKEKIAGIVASNKYFIDKKKNRVFHSKNGKELYADASGTTPIYCFRINKKTVKINKYVFWSYIHKLIDDTFDTKYQKIIFKNRKEEYTKENIYISFKGDKL